ncbi:hypothetical protein VFPBJ_10765 [Purpureocillium lilacinum]|uniref:Uncharacterized protein n=1 Tax=Purpureocillium lilacinum TaxID=33203 RepID=A0A179FW12_PURLI|nr:hypothetical protein VFPBJ_10765 [Purpureocillium lilacinum]
MAAYRRRLTAVRHRETTKRASLCRLLTQSHAVIGAECLLTRATSELDPELALLSTVLVQPGRRNLISVGHCVGCTFRWGVESSFAIGQLPANQTF